MRLAAAFLICASAAFSQVTTTLPMPQPEIQYLDSTGAPLAGGKLCTYLANSSTPSATYTDSTGVTANSNPVVLDSAGRASVWVGFRLYKFVLRSGGDGTCSTGSILWTQDNVGIIQAGNVNALYVQQSGSGSSGRGGYIDMPPIDYPNSTCFDVYGNPVNQPLQQSGYPAFGANDVIMWNSMSPLAGVSPPGCATQFTPNVTFGLNVNTYIFALAGFASGYTSYNTFDALSGGMHALSFSADNYVNAGHHAGTPPLTTFDSFNAGAIFYDDTATCMKFYNGSAWACFGSGGGGGGAVGPANAVQMTDGAGSFLGTAKFLFDPVAQSASITAVNTSSVGLSTNGYISATGGFTTTSSATNAIQAPNGSVTGKLVSATDSWILTEEAAPALSASGQARMYADTSAHVLKVSNNGGAYATFGGSGTISSSTASYVTYYTGATTVNGSANFVWTNAIQNLTVTALNSGVPGITVATGFVQTDAGFVGSASATGYNAFRAPLGGMVALNLDATNYIKVGTSTGAPTPTSGDSITAGTLYWDNSGVLKVYDGATWASLAAGSTTAFGSLTSGTNTTAAMIIGTGGSLTVSGSGSINATKINGGTVPGTIGNIWATNASNQPVAAIAANVVALWSAGSGSCTGTNVLAANGTCLIGGGGGVVSIAAPGGTATGAVTFVQTSNQVLIAESGGNTLTFSLPQSIATSSSVTFGNVAVGSQVTAGTTISANNGFLVGITSVIDSSRNFSGGTATFSGFASVGGNLTVSGLTTLSAGAVVAGALFSTGSFYQPYVGASSGVSCAAVANGWSAVTSDGYFVTCLNSGTRYRAAVTAY